MTGEMGTGRGRAAKGKEGLPISQQRALLKLAVAVGLKTDFSAVSNQGSPAFCP